MSQKHVVLFLYHVVKKLLTLSLFFLSVIDTAFIKLNELSKNAYMHGNANLRNVNEVRFSEFSVFLYIYISTK